MKERYPEIDAATALLDRRLRRVRVAEQQAFARSVDRVWIHHDSALDGLVVPMEEINAATSGQAPADSGLAPIYREVEAHLKAITKVREEAARRKPGIRMSFIRDLYETFAGEHYDPRRTCYRRDIPVHRLYFHEIAGPDRIAYRMNRLLTWANSAEFRKHHAIAAGTIFHYRFMEVFPFPTHSGKIGRLIMNLILISGGYHPVVLHYTDRHRYYESLRGEVEGLARLIEESMENSLRSSIRFVEQRKMLLG